MKKILSAILAVAMIASMSAVALAAQPAIATGNAAALGDDLGVPFLGGVYEDDFTVKVDDAKAFYPVVGLLGPYGYFADDKVLFDNTPRTWNNGTNDYDVYAAPIEFGDTAYYALIQFVPDNYATLTDANDGDAIAEGTDGYYTIVTESETVSSLKIKQEWEEGEDFVKSVSVVKKKVCNKNAGYDLDFEYSGDDSQDDPDMPYPNAADLGIDDYAYDYDTNNGMYMYFLAIKYEDSTSVNDADVIGHITLSKSKDPSVDKLELPIGVTVDWENSYRNPTNGTDFKVDGNQADLKAGKNYALKFECDEEVELVFDNESYFEVDVSGQSKMLFSYNTDYIARIAAKYPYAELNFWNGNGAKFNRVGQMFLSCEDLTGTQFLYQVTSDGKLTEVPGAEWDDSDEGFYFNTRVLGSYVISDMELDTVEEEIANNNTVVAPAPVVTNPATGVVA